MHTDKELFSFIKEAYSLTPNPKYVKDTEIKLKHIAKRRELKRKVRHFSFATIGVLFCLASFWWLFSLGGKDFVTNFVQSPRANDTKSTQVITEPEVLIYHTHNRESFLPDINKTDVKDAWDEKINVTLVGDKLKLSLEENGIGVKHDKTDISNILLEKGLPFSDSYMVYRETLEAIYNQNKSLKIAFDVHRDSLVDSAKTTVRIKEKDYARIYFVLSGSHNNYKQNEQFAILLQEKMEHEYPGITRGVRISKGPQQSTYNQDLFNRSIIVEVGGPKNSLEEVNSTMEAFSEIMTEVITNKEY